MSRTCEFCLAMSACLLAMSGSALAAPHDNPPRRGKPPVFSQDVLEAFFEDAREHLVGERPVKTDAATILSASPSPGAATNAESAKEYSWSQLVDGETLAAEVKRLAAGLREPLANPAKFKSGGYQQCRADFSELAILFAVIADYDGDVRWKTDAAPLRDALARGGRNCATATDQTFTEAVVLKTQLNDLVRGERLGGAPGAKLENWSDLADRPLLMSRMELALEERISPALANAKEFAKRAPQVREESELLALLADVIQREAYEYWDDEVFREHAQALRDAALEMSHAVTEGNYDAARAAAGRAEQACSVCHEGYRG